MRSALQVRLEEPARVRGFGRGHGLGRTGDADPPAGGKIVLDFNRAYSPPCAFTPHATCPLPPANNRLPVAVEAGELFAGH